jgi:ABC-type multidrug transport system ATPase subunit
MRRSLVIESADPVVKVALHAEDCFVVGRSGAANLPLNDPAISRQHCAIIPSPDGTQIEDLGGAGGTFVNGTRVLGRVRLTNGDQIRIGSTVLRFRVEPHSCPQPTLVGADDKLASKLPDSDVTLGRRPRALHPALPNSGPSTLQPAALSPISLKQRLIIGRDPQCDVVLPSRDVSRCHAEIRGENGTYSVRDLSSTNGTFVNGAEVRGRTALREGCRLRVGPYTFLLRGEFLLPSCQKGKVRITLHNVSQKITDRATRQKLLLLDGISLVIEPNEFVALLGPSGSGKSTLMDAVNGRRPASSGRVMVNEDDFYSAYRYYRRAIGYVPQKDIVHATLTIHQALTFTARLRLPSDTSGQEIERVVSEVIQKIGLSERRHTLVGNLSGGQAKRVSLGAELIADPSLLFLDEATSGLDAGTEAKMMTLFRQIADEGKTVMCITHNVENVKLCDLVVVLAKGRLVYYGPPTEAPGFFDVSQISEIYDRLESTSAEEWANRFQASAFQQRYVAGRSKTTTMEQKALQVPDLRAGTQVSLRETCRQMKVLTSRYATVLLQDRKNVALLLGQAPLIGLLLGTVFANGAAQDHRLVVFLMAISAIWFGCINASREVVKELPIYLRERAVNLELFAYLGSKVLVLTALCAVQCLALFMIVSPLTSLHADTGKLLLTLLLTAISGMLMGLVVSALVDTADKAMAIVPVLLIPQVILANIITPLEGFTRTIAHWCIVSFWAVDAMLNTLPGGPGLAVPPHHPWAEDVCVLCLFMVACGAAAAWALKRHDKLG